MSNEHEAQPGPGDVLGQYVTDCKREHEPDDERQPDPRPRTLFILELVGDVLSSNLDAAIARAGFTVTGETTAYALDPERENLGGDQHDRVFSVCRACGYVGVEEEGRAYCDVCTEHAEEAGIELVPFASEGASHD